jgi:hypothetical protein
MHGVFTPATARADEAPRLGHPSTQARLRRRASRRSPGMVTAVNVPSSPTGHCFPLPDASSGHACANVGAGRRELAVKTSPCQSGRRGSAALLLTLLLI